jgi:carbon monoxide dehydrogenase subunit G
MKMNGSYEIAADRETVWAALNDPEILRECIPGCDSLEMTAENELTAAVTAKVGPVKAKFTGVVELKDLNPPESYRIEGSGKGGAAGFAKGGADVRLAESDGGTTLTYEADAQVGGKLAQIGARLIDGTAKKMAEQFFGAFSEKVASGAASDEAPVEAEQEAGTASAAATADAEPRTADQSVEEMDSGEDAGANAEASASEEASVAPDPAPAATVDAGRNSPTGLPAWVWLLGLVGLIIVAVALVS